MNELIKAVCKGTLFDGAADCYVLADERRVLSQRGAVRALTAKNDGKNDGANPGNLSRYFSRLPSKYAANTPMPKPIEFTRPGGGVATGIEAEHFVDLLQAYVDAQIDGALHPTQVHLARNAQRMLRAFQKVGVRALVDEATGYQLKRAHDDLERLFGRALRDDPAEYGPLWHSRLIREICRLYGRLYRDGERIPQWLQSPMAYVYRVILGEAVASELQRRNPFPRAGTNHHQWLTEQARAVTEDDLKLVFVLAQESISADDWKKRLARHFKRHGDGQVDLFS